MEKLKRKRVNILIESDKMESLKRYCNENEITMSNLIRDMIEKKVKKNK